MGQLGCSFYREEIIMKKILAAVLCMVMVLATFAGCGGTADTAGSAPSGEERTTFTVGFDAEYPPFGYMADDGSYTGFDLELAQAVCELEGWEFVATPIDWDAKDMELNSGSIDCIWNGFTINGREDDYAWSKPYCDNSQVVVVKEGSGISTLADLAGKTVGVQGHTCQPIQIRTQPVQNHAVVKLGRDRKSKRTEKPLGKPQTAADSRKNTVFHCFLLFQLNFSFSPREVKSCTNLQK